MRRDPRGRVYYVDHNTRQTTWQRPNGDRLQNFASWQGERAQVTQKLTRHMDITSSTTVLIGYNYWPPSGRLRLLSAAWPLYPRSLYFMGTVLTFTDFSWNPLVEAGCHIGQVIVVLLVTNE